MVIDTADTKFVGEGTIDLDKEVVDLALQGRAKNFSLLSADAAVYLSGDFTNFSISTDVPEALLSALTPIELGLGEDADCQALIDYARQNSAQEWQTAERCDTLACIRRPCGVPQGLGQLVPGDTVNISL